MLYNDLDEAVRSLTPLIVPPSIHGDVRTELAAAIATVRSGYAPRPAQRAAQR